MYEALFVLLHAAIEAERLGQPLERFGNVRLALKHDVLHAQFRIVTISKRQILA